MRYLVNTLAQYEVHVARYYMRRGAYLAAANRSQYAIKTYQMNLGKHGFLRELGVDEPLDKDGPLDVEADVVFDAVGG